MNRTKLTQYIIHALQEEGATHIFMVPGGYVDNFSQDLVSVEGFRAIVCASESGAAMMADGFARASGRFGVCMGIAGPGASNMLTGLSVSYADQIPVLVITGEAPLGWRDRDAIQDSGTHGLRTSELFRLISTSQYHVYQPSLIRDYLRRSMLVLKGPNQGVAHVSLPLDLQTNEVVYDYEITTSDEQLGGTPIDQSGLDTCLDLMAKHTKIVCLIGQGIRESNAADALIEFSERFDIPVATTMSAKGDFPENHPLSLGIFGWAGSCLANETLLTDEVDCLVIVGSKLGQTSTMCWDDNLRSGRTFIQIDSSSSNLNRTYVADLAITSEIKSAFEYLSTLNISHRQVSTLLKSSASRKDWLATIYATRPRYYDEENQFSEQVPIHPARAISDLAATMPEETLLFTDNGAHTFFTSHYWQSTLPHHFFNIIEHSGAMGWAIPASIGAKMAFPHKTTVAVVGDGCMLMQGMEIQTAARYMLTKMIFIVINNQAHGNPKLRSSKFSDSAQALTDIVDHNWAKFAESLGLIGIAVDEPQDLSQAYLTALTAKKPALIDVKCGLYPTPTKVFDETFMKEFSQFTD